MLRRYLFRAEGLKPFTAICPCGLLAPFAWWLGAAELRDIKAGLSPDSGQGLATAGMVLGIIGTVFLVISCCGALVYLLFWIGLIGTGLAFGLR
jgi:hypothetical protein